MRFFSFMKNAKKNKELRYNVFKKAFSHQLFRAFFSPLFFWLPPRRGGLSSNYYLRSSKRDNWKKDFSSFFFLLQKVFFSLNSLCISFSEYLSPNISPNISLRIFLSLCSLQKTIFPALSLSRKKAIGRSKDLPIVLWREREKRERKGREMLLLFWNEKTVGRSKDLPIAFLREKDIWRDIRRDMFGERYSERNSEKGIWRIEVLPQQCFAFLRTKPEKDLLIIYLLIIYLLIIYLLIIYLLIIFAEEKNRKREPELIYIILFGYNIDFGRDS